MGHQQLSKITQSGHTGLSTIITQQRFHWSLKCNFAKGSSVKEISLPMVSPVSTSQIQKQFFVAPVFCSNFPFENNKIILYSYLYSNIKVIIACLDHHGNTGEDVCTSDFLVKVGLSLTFVLHDVGQGKRALVIYCKSLQDFAMVENLRQCWSRNECILDIAHMPLLLSCLALMSKSFQLVMRYLLLADLQFQLLLKWSWSWSSLVKGDEQLDWPNSQTTLEIC